MRELLERSQFANAVYAARAALDRAPGNRDLLYMLAVGQRYLNRLPDALDTLARIEALFPNYSRLHQERGHCHVALRAAEPAIAAFEQAVRINPALPASWQALSVLYRMTGRPAAADTASAHVAKLGSLPVEIVTATSMFADGEIHEAERLVRQFLLSHGDHVEGMRLLARIGIHLDILDDAELLLEGVLNLAPGYVAARVDYAVVLSKRHRNEKALEEIAKLRAAEPGNRLFRTLEANAYAGLGHHDEALERFRELTLETPDNPELHVSVGHALKTLGRQSEAIAAYRASAAARPGYGDAYWSLANLKTYRFTDVELALMREQEAAPATAAFDRYHLCFALGKALEDRSGYAESFRYYERGNALKRAECRYNADTMTRNLRTQAAVLTRELFAARSGWGCDRPDPIFIVGLPRSGSTLLEQVLASHSKVEGTMELA